MGYIDDNLMTGEHVIYRANLHWIVFLWPIIFIIIAFMFLSAQNTAVEPPKENYSKQYFSTRPNSKIINSKLYNNPTIPNEKIAESNHHGLFSGLFLTLIGGSYSPVGIFFIIIALISGTSAIINLKTSEFGITNKRVIVKIGFIRRDSLEVLLNKVEGIQVNQGILGRIFGFGSITITGTGGAKNPFHNITAPLKFRKIAQEQIASVQD